MNIYLIISTALFFLLAIIWKKSDWVNVFVKVCLLALFVFGLIVTLSYFGYIVKQN